MSKSIVGKNVLQEVYVHAMSIKKKKYPENTLVVLSNREYVGSISNTTVQLLILWRCGIVFVTFLFAPYFLTFSWSLYLGLSARHTHTHKPTENTQGQNCPSQPSFFPFVLFVIISRISQCDFIKLCAM